ncbi:3-oxo-5-alpha-steroid 4-dehydrogenase-domain-containing protein [Entophlyctis helioformis]|nr:3-oxo-5-alpha-steroid 4-dehydrogenase-domain-containing protein [Entophlyctis helioformis]
MMVAIRSKAGKTLIEALDLDTSKGTVDDVCKAIANAVPKYTIPRQRLTLQRPEGVVVLQRGEQLAKYQIKSGETIFFKDLGPQIDWTTVFLIEYFGPIIIHPLFYFFPEYIYGQAAVDANPNRTIVQQISLILFILHFIKREFETVYVHRFSNDTMPYRNLPKNCFHYWVLGGFMVAYPLYRPGFNGGFFTALASPAILLPLLGLWVFAQVSNLKTHYILRNLRPPGTRVRNIPMGYGFNLVSCPNYFFEILGWVIVSLITGSIAVWVFALAGAGQMYLWAVKKHQRYRKEFGDKYPRRRKILIPFLL